LKNSLKKTYWIAFGALVLASLLSLFLRLDFSNAKLILEELRYPRLLAGIAIGGALAVSGLVMQTVLSNPLGEPYTLGVASGAALGAAMASTINFRLNFYGLNVGAVFGALVILFILIKLVTKGIQQSDSMILLGVMLSLTCASLLAVWMALADPMGVQSVNFWLLGDLSRVELRAGFALLFLSFLVCGYFWLFYRKLDAFLFGEEQVESFGVSFEDTRNVAIVLVSILVGFCVSAAGMIGFVGLIVPHLLRRQLRTSLHFHLIPLTFIWGSVLLVMSDTIAKTLSQPHELPVGAVTAIVGAPLFIWFFMKRRNWVAS
jgi:iron complex transport system permease protein